MLLHLSSLAPRTEVFTHDTGHSALLLQLRGTLPVVFRGATYHIPVAIWLPRAYPREPPMVFVEPTSTMLVRQGPDVELSGRVKGVYLKQWERKWEVSAACGGWKSAFVARGAGGARARLPEGPARAPSLSSQALAAPRLRFVSDLQPRCSHAIAARALLADAAGLCQAGAASHAVRLCLARPCRACEPVDVACAAVSTTASRSSSATAAALERSR